MAKGAGRASGVTQHVGASVAKRDAHLERERVQRERFRELYNQGERSGAVLAAWEAEPVDEPRYDNSWVRPPRAKDGDDRASAPAPGRAGGARADESEDDPETQDTVTLPSDSEEELDEEDDDELWTESDEEEGEDGADERVAAGRSTAATPKKQKVSLFERAALVVGSKPLGAPKPAGYDLGIKLRRVRELYLRYRREMFGARVDSYALTRRAIHIRYSNLIPR